MQQLLWSRLVIALVEQRLVRYHGGVTQLYISKFNVINIWHLLSDYIMFAMLLRLFTSFLRFVLCTGVLEQQA
jgi:hypothetical protein